MAGKGRESQVQAGAGQGRAAGAGDAADKSRNGTVPLEDLYGLKADGAYAEFNEEARVHDYRGARADRQWVDSAVELVNSSGVAAGEAAAFSEGTDRALMALAEYVATGNRRHGRSILARLNGGPLWWVGRCGVAVLGRLGRDLRFPEGQDGRG